MAPVHLVGFSVAARECTAGLDVSGVVAPRGFDSMEALEGTPKWKTW